MSTRIVYSELDSLYDTTLAIICAVDKRLLKEYLLDTMNIPNYVGYLSNDMISNLYADRTNDILLASKSSSVLELIRKIVSDMEIRRKSDIEVTEGSIEIHINVYPYKLTDDEKLELEKFFHSQVLHIERVVIIDKARLSDDYIEQLNIMVLRYGIKWVLDRKVEDPSFRSTTRLITSNKLTNDIEIDDVDKFREYLETSTLGIMRLELIEDELFKLKLID